MFRSYDSTEPELGDAVGLTVGAYSDIFPSAGSDSLAVSSVSAVKNGDDDMPKPAASNDIDGYIAQFPDDVQTILQNIRATIHRAAPDAREVISYQLPAFEQHGILVYFAAWKKHIGLYPPIDGDKALEKSVERYAGPKGNLQFPLDEPMPYDLIERIVKLRVKQDMAKAAAKKKKR